MTEFEAEKARLEVRIAERKLDAVGISLDGTEIDAFTATVAKKELLEMSKMP